MLEKPQPPEARFECRGVSLWPFDNRRRTGPWSERSKADVYGTPPQIVRDVLGLERKEGHFNGETISGLEIDSKSITEQGEFEGYLSVFNSVDQGGDIVMPGAFTESLRKRPAERVKLLAYHDTRQPVGVWKSLIEDGRGLKAKGQILLTTERGREMYELMKVGAVDGLSIGYRSIDDEFDRAKGVRRLKKVDLMEGSLVTFPMHSDATVATVKGGKLPTIREIERTLMREAGLSASQAKALLGGGYKSLEAARDAGAGDATLDQALRDLAATIRG